MHHAHTEPQEALRKALAGLTGLGELSAEVAVLTAAVEQFAPRFVEVLHTGHGWVTVKVRNKRLAGVGWQQGVMFGEYQ